MDTEINMFGEVCAKTLTTLKCTGCGNAMSEADFCLMNDKPYHAGCAGTAAADQCFNRLPTKEDEG